MKNIKKYLLLLLVAIVPFINVNADEIEETKNFNFKTGENININEIIDGSSIIVGNNVVSSNVVKGIDILFGNNVEFKGNSDYVLFIGTNVEISGTINNDGLILGDLITFDSSTVSNRDLFIFGNSVTISGTVNRDVTIYATTVLVDNIEVLENMTINATNIEIKDNTKINGELSYNKDAIIELSNNAFIGSTKLTEDLIQELSVQETIVTILVDYCSYLLLFLVIALILPVLFKKIEKANEDFNVMNLFSSLGFGTLSLILVPIIFIVLCSFTIGFQVAILLLILYIITIWLSQMFAGYLLGYIIWKRFIKKEQNTLLIGLVGITTLTILSNMPIIGGLVSVLSLLVGVGIIVRSIMKQESN